jgi:hypothetical protein
MASVSAAAACTVRPEVLRGAWALTNRAGFFEQMEFTSEGGSHVFNSWRHDRPEISGATWSLENCVLRISGPNGRSSSFVYVARMRTGQQLELRETGQPVAKYKRIKE